MTLFALVIVGYVGGKLGYLGGDFDRQLSKLVINITCPALILSSAMTGELPDRRFILPLLLISINSNMVKYLILFISILFLWKSLVGTYSCICPQSICSLIVFSVRLDLQSSRSEYKDFQSALSHCKCSYSLRSDCKSARTSECYFITFFPFTM